MKPKYLVYNSSQWWDGAYASDTLEDAEKDFERELKNLSYDWVPTDSEYVVITKVIKCVTAKDKFKDENKK